MTVTPAAGGFPYMKFDTADPNVPALLWTVTLDGLTVFQVTTDTAWDDSNPVVNAAGTMLAYHREPADGSGTNNVAVVNVDGTGIAQLTSSVAPNFSANPDWSPAADLIVFEERNVGILTMAGDGSGLTTIVARVAPDRLLRPQFNRDGTKVAYYRRVGPALTNVELRCCNADGSGDIALDPTPRAFRNGSYFAWLNGSDVVVWGNGLTGVNARIFSVNADGTGMATVWAGAAGDTNAIVAARSVTSDDLAVIAPGTFSASGSQIFAYALDGSGRTALAPAQFSNGSVFPTIASSRVYAVAYTAPATLAFVSTDETGAGGRTEDTPGADIAFSDFTA